MFIVEVLQLQLHLMIISQQNKQKNGTFFVWIMTVVFNCSYLVLFHVNLEWDIHEIWLNLDYCVEWWSVGIIQLYTVLDFMKIEWQWSSLEMRWHSCLKEQQIDIRSSKSNRNCEKYLDVDLNTVWSLIILSLSKDGPRCLNIYRAHNTQLS